VQHRVSAVIASSHLWHLAHLSGSHRWIEYLANHSALKQTKDIFCVVIGSPSRDAANSGFSFGAFVLI
ncbi:MAG: hypothetical protein WCG38_08955, partial [Aestuariivirga sp.]